MSYYYYVAATLPTVRLGDKVPITEDRFLQFLADTLHAKDYQIILKSRLGCAEQTGFLFSDRILAWEMELRLRLAKARLTKLKFEPIYALPVTDDREFLQEKARTAIAMSSPLEAECFLNNLRWSFVEEMGTLHFFDLESLVAYFFKLQIAIRQEKFQRELGIEHFEKTYETINEIWNRSSSVTTL